MLSSDVRLEGFTTTDWVRVLSLFQPRPEGSEARDPDRPRGGVIAVHADGALVKLLHTQAGRLRLDDLARQWPVTTEELARRHDASWAATLEAGALATIMDRFGARARRGDDLVAQVLTLTELGRDELIAGRIELWPHRLRGVPVPSRGMVRTSIDSICPVGRSLVVGLFEAGELWTSLVLRRGVTGFNLVLGPDELRADMGLLSGDWRRDYRHLAEAVEQRAGALALGCYAQVQTLRALEVDPSPGAWARAVAVRDVILSPLPAALTVPLGIDAARGAFALARDVAMRVDPLGLLGPSLDAVRTWARGDGVDEREAGRAGMFGFHPLELLRKLLSRTE